MTDKELLQQALDALNEFDSGKRNHGMTWQVPLIKTIKARLAQPEQVAYDLNGATVYIKPPIYTAPPKKEWVGLTDDEYESMAEQYVTNCYFDTLEYAKAIETKLKEKNT